MKIFFFKKIKNRPRWLYTELNSEYSSTTTVTEFSKTFLVFYKWPDLTDVQVVLTVLDLVQYMYNNLSRVLLY
jgi:hypothetical protein